MTEAAACLDLQNRRNTTISAAKYAWSAGSSSDRASQSRQSGNEIEAFSSIGASIPQ